MYDQMNVRSLIQKLKDDIEDILKPYLIDDAINQLKDGLLVASITAPPYAGLPELIHLAQKNGIGININHPAKLILVPADPNISVNHENTVKVLLLPTNKKYQEQLKNLNHEQIQQANMLYEVLAKDQDVFDIILNENESPRKTFITLLHKLHLLQVLRNIPERQTQTENINDISCFIIWGHGLKYKKAILDKIAEHYNIIVIKNKKISNITEFLRAIYIEEVLKMGHHILSKNKHLQRQKKEATLILAKSNQDKSSFVCEGHGPEQRVCTSMEEHLKQEIRDIYNPSKANGMRSEQHVIHGTHSLPQIENLLSLFGLKPLNNWIDNSIINEGIEIKDNLNWQTSDFKFLRLQLEKWRATNLQAELETRRENIETLSKILQNNGVFFWIHGKTLLGIVRYNHFIVDDHDDDVGVFIEDRKIVCSKIYLQLKEQGFQAIRYNNLMLSVIKNNRYIDICFFRVDKDKVGYGGKWYPKKHFDKLDSVFFHGKEYPIPNNVLQLLEFMYPYQASRLRFLKNMYGPVKLIKRKFKQGRRWLKSKIMQKVIIRQMPYKEFINCKIEDDASINWTLRKPHLDLITNYGLLRKIGDIINYFKKDTSLEYVNSDHVCETDTSKPFTEPINLNNKFWQTGNNFFFYSIYYGFRKNIVPYDRANIYIENIKEPQLYSAQYFKNLEPMNDIEIEDLLQKEPIIVSKGAIVHGKHRVCAMIGRLITDKQYIPFYVREYVPRFTTKKKM